MMISAPGALTSNLANTYPLTVTNVVDGKTLITMAKEPEHTTLQDSCDTLSLALLDRKNPLRRVAA